jgi:hypothetical protein
MNPRISSWSAASIVNVAPFSRRTARLKRRRASLRRYVRMQHAFGFGRITDNAS